MHITFRRLFACILRSWSLSPCKVSLTLVHGMQATMPSPPATYRPYMRSAHSKPRRQSMCTAACTCLVPSMCHSCYCQSYRSAILPHLSSHLSCLHHYLSFDLAFMCRGVYIAYAIVAWCYFGVSYTGYHSYGNIVKDSVLASISGPKWMLAMANIFVFIHVIGSTCP